MNKFLNYSGFLFFMLTCHFWASCQSKVVVNKEHTFDQLPAKQSGTLDTATFAAGCFWCIEAQFKELNGVTQVLSGYMGGHVKNPSYTAVSLGNTGHAEVIQVLYDVKVIAYEKLLQAFFYAHDPTQFNRQGNDIGTQYRSAVFVYDQKQLTSVRFIVRKLTEEALYHSPIVTEIVPAQVFYQAEDYHQNYYANNKNDAYCQYVIKPKLEKFKHIFSTRNESH